MSKLYVDEIAPKTGSTIIMPTTAFVTPSSSGAITYTVRAWKAGNAVTAQYASGPSMISIQEIQQ